MKQNNIFRKTTALLLVLTIVLFSGCAAKKKDDTSAQALEQTPAQVSYNTKADNVQKNETVYVTVDNYGNVNNTIVSDWIHTDKAETYVNDISDLQDIKNVKSDVQPVMNDGNLVWNMPTTDLYYSGTSDKTLPVTISVKYFLDDAEISAEDIAGKTGRVKMEITMQNNLFRTEKIGNKEVKIYNPVAVVGGMILSESQFQNISVENGELVGDGTKEIAMLIGMPGINETLGLKSFNIENAQEIEFNDTFTVTADASDFTLGNMYFAALPLSSLDSSLTIPNSVEELKTSLKQLKNIEKALKTVDPNGLITKLMQNPSQITDLTSMLQDTIALYQQNKVLFDLLPKYLTEENINALNNLTQDSNGSSLKQFLLLLSDSEVQQFIKLMPGAAADVKDLLPLMQQLSKDMEDPEVKAAIDRLPETMNQLSAIQEKLNANKDTIDGLSKILSNDNVAVISAALEGVDGDEFVKKLEQYGVIIDNSDDLVERVNSMLKFSKEYNIYTQSTPEMETSLMFVYKTAPINKPVTVSEETTQVKESWFKKLFNK